MAFTDKDRETLNGLVKTSVKTATTVDLMKEGHDRRLEALEAEDKVLHHRINVVRNIYIGVSAGVAAVSSGITAWIKSQGGN